MRMRGLCVLASLLLCDKDFNAEGAEEQRGKGGCRCGWGEKNGIIRKNNEGFVNNCLLQWRRHD